MKASMHQQAEKRRTSRQKIKGTLRVEDQMSGELIGHIVDLSEAGFMLQSSHDIPGNCILQLRIHMPSPINGRDVIEVGAECIWSNTPSSSKTCWSGFQIIDISADDAQILQMVLTTP